VKFEDFSERAKAHSGEAAIQLSVLFEDPLGDTVEVLRGLGEKVADGRSRKLVERDIEPLSHFSPSPFSVTREVQREGHGGKVNGRAYQSHLRSLNAEAGAAPLYVTACPANARRWR
jgi:hypothetical protein